MTEKFLMESGALRRYLSARDRVSLSDAGRALTRESKPLYNTIDRQAVIPVRGVLSDNVSFFDILLGTAPELTYSEIVQAIDAANDDSGVDGITLFVDSPGGYVDGAEMAALAVATSPKPVTAKVGTMAASAAYWIASQSGRIEASARTAAIGSIGVATVAFKDDGVFEIASTAAPKKRPDPSTEDGAAAIREELDAIHAIFAGDVARGRGVSVDKVNAEFGQGGVVLADEAVKRGMIDSLEIAKIPAVGGQAGEAVNKQEVEKMTLEEFKASNPEGAKALIEEGKKAERERVAGLTEFKKINSACAQIVEEAIQSGKDYSAVSVQLAAAAAKGPDVQEPAAPVVQTSAASVEALTAEESAACKAMGITEEAYLAQKKKVRG